MSKKPIAYEPHPVSPERKKELIAKGYRIIDAKFDPDRDKKAKSQESGTKKQTKTSDEGNKE